MQHFGPETAERSRSAKAFGAETTFKAAIRSVSAVTPYITGQKCMQLTQPCMFPMYIANSAPANRLPAITQTFWQPKVVGKKSRSSARQQLLKQPYNLIVPTAHRAQIACASRKVEAGPDIPVARNTVAAVPEPHIPVLPLSLLGSLSAAWLCTARYPKCFHACICTAVTAMQHLCRTSTLAQGGCCPCRGSTAVQCGTLLLLDVVYAGMHMPPNKSTPAALAVACCTQVGNSLVTHPSDVYPVGLHLQPLLPLFQIGRAPDIAFMKSYTKATYFVSECLLLGWLLSNGIIRSEPDSAFSHVLQDPCLLLQKMVP